jgi:hypothetical protein
MSITSHKDIRTKIIHVGPPRERDAPSPKRDVFTGTSDGQDGRGGGAIEHEVIAGLPDGPHDSRNAEVPSGRGNTKGGGKLPDGELLRGDRDAEACPDVTGQGALEEEVAGGLHRVTSSTSVRGGATLAKEVRPRTQAVDVGEIREDLQLGGEPKSPDHTCRGVRGVWRREHAICFPRAETGAPRVVDEAPI